MKFLIIAIAATFAVPAAAQTAPMPQHQGHAHHQPGQSGQPAMHHDSHEGHAMGDCCRDRNGNGVMDCCEGMQCGDRRSATPTASGQPAAPAHQGHQQH